MSKVIELAREGVELHEYDAPEYIVCSAVISQSQEIEQLRAELIASADEQNRLNAVAHDQFMQLAEKDTELADARRAAKCESDIAAQAIAELAAAREQIERLNGQLPDGMKHCTIEFLECDKGHGSLSAANWIKSGCKQCEIERLSKDAHRLDYLDAQRGDVTGFDGYGNYCLSAHDWKIEGQHSDIRSAIDAAIESAGGK